MTDSRRSFFRRKTFGFHFSFIQRKTLKNRVQNVYLDNFKTTIRIVRRLCRRSTRLLLKFVNLHSALVSQRHRHLWLNSMRNSEKKLCSAVRQQRHRILLRILNENFPMIHLETKIFVLKSFLKAKTTTTTTTKKKFLF